MEELRHLKAGHDRGDYPVWITLTGGFIPSCDHQTPPDVPLDRYREYVELFFAYAREAVR